MSEFDLKFFLMKVNKTDTCWIWKGALDGSGYGQCTINSKAYKAHRLSYRYFNGNISDGLVVMHKCDNKPCVNPFHLTLGFIKDNVKDMFDKKRQGGNSIKALTNTEVEEAMALRKLGYTYIKIGEVMKYSETTVWRAINKLCAYTVER